jgi:hypothetical protein
MTRISPRAFGLLTLSLAAAVAHAEDIPRPEHPDPMAVREHWTNLNGRWDFRFDPGDEGLEAKWFEPGARGFDGTIVVPFGWESELSGIHDTSGASKVGWYRRVFRVPDDFPKDERVWLRLGAVDWRADVWVNGKKVAEHEGGYTPIEADVTDAVDRSGENTLVVRAFDPTDPSLPTGKQVGWYTTTSGIWQTVWLESRPSAYIADFTVTTAIDPSSATFRLRLKGLPEGEYRPEFRFNSETVDASADGKLQRDGEAATFEATFPVREPELWTPETPKLYDVTIALKGPDGRVVDSVATYFGLRTIARGKYGNEPFERVLLNGKPIYLRGALDQSYNPQGIYTAPSDEFLRKDIELAKSVGTNFLRIHIKPEEPRRLYWADKLGMLIMEDMPNTWRQNPKAREAWEPTMREVLARDKNHPSIFSWVMFNETWGLEHPRYRTDKDTQAWVKSMVAQAREIDPTRLVEDNSPCNYDHVEGTDLNSWHFYIDDHREAKRHIEEVVARSEPGSSFNYCEGEAMNSAPLINSEYGSVSAGGGDRDVSWGFRDLTTQLRKHNKIQGYIYTELTDIEWEHNGFANYDRTPKTFAYEEWVPGMTLADLQGADFVGYDAPPAIEAKVGELIAVPLFVSHYSDRTDAPTLKWSVRGVNAMGEPTSIEPRERPVEWKPYSVTPQKRIAFRIHEPFVGAVGLVLEDPLGRKIAANFVNVVVRPEKTPPRVERLDDHTVALRFDPGDFASATWSDGLSTPDGKAAGLGSGRFTYRLKLPEAVAKAKPKSIHVHAELSSRAGRKKVDWPERVNAQDYPQTDARKWPSSVEVIVNEVPLIGIELPDDPADALGVLSHLKKVDHGSHGEWVDTAHELNQATRESLASGEPLVLRLSVPEGDGPAGGLAIYGAETGLIPSDPTILVETEEALPADLGVDPTAPAAIDTAASRRVPVLATGEAGAEEAADWSYTTDRPVDAWRDADFDDSSWKHAPGGFGTPGTPAIAVATRWDSSRIWLRKSVDLPELGPDDALTLRLFHDEDVDIFVNGERLYRGRGYLTAYQDLPLNAEQRALFRPGKNVIAVSCRQTGGGQGIDLGLLLLKGQE